MASQKQTGTRIKKWLEEEGYTIQLSSEKEWEFIIHVIDPFEKGIDIAISQRVGMGIMGIVTGISLPKNIIAIFEKLDKGSKIELIQSLHRTLLSMIQDHVVDGDLKKISITERVYVENLTRQKFMESFIKLRNTLLYLIAVLRHTFGQEEAPQPSTTPKHDFYR